MSDQLHVVLGGTGAIAQEVIADLKAKGLPVRAVSRRPVNGVETVQADLLDAEAARSAIAGASHAYLCVGLPYNTEVWKRDWPLLMKNVIDACAETNARLIFFDNAYGYGPAPLQNPITEEHPLETPSKKGKIRRAVVAGLLTAHAEGRVKAVVGRSAVFYGPGATNSPVVITVVNNLVAGKQPQWIGRPDTRQSMNYTVDAARALVALALDEEAYGQIWHLPVDAPALTPQQVATKLAEIVGKPELGKLQVPPKFMLPLLGMMVPGIHELQEMLYQFESDYIFSDAKFRQRYPTFSVTPYDEGLAATVAYYQVHAAEKPNA